MLSAERKKKAGVLKSGEESTSGGAGAASAALLPYPATEKVIISFASPIAEGHVMVSLNDRFIFRKSFSFGKESNGGLVEGRADIPIGRGSFKVWVIAPDRSVNQFRELAAIVSAGETKTLHLDLDTARNLSVSFR